jgi:hypothetical protein
MVRREEFRGEFKLFGRKLIRLLIRSALSTFDVWEKIEKAVGD